MKHMLVLITLLFVALSDTAGAQQYRDWKVSAADDGSLIFAETENDSGGSFGLVCYTSNQMCYWVLVVGPTCSPDTDYIALANSASGALAHQLKCSVVGSARLMVFKDFSAVEDVVNTDSRLGIAFPMESGTFTVSRFSLSGAKAAADAARAITAKADSKSTRDTTL